MKNVLNVTQEEINGVGQLTEDELQLLYEMEGEIESEIQEEMKDLEGQQDSINQLQKLDSIVLDN